MTQDEFGQPIEREKANVFFNRFLAIKKRTAPILQEVLANDPEALRFYCGRQGQEYSPENEDWAYIFDRQGLERAMKLIFSDQQADGLAIFPGIRSEADSPEGTDVDGRPTLMLFPYKHGKDEKGNDTFRILGNEGTEHPGTGSGRGSRLNSDGLPDVFSREDVHRIG